MSPDEGCQALVMSNHDDLDDTIRLPRIPSEAEDWETLRQLAGVRESARAAGDKYYRLIGINTIRRIQGLLASVRL